MPFIYVIIIIKGLIKIKLLFFEVILLIGVKVSCIIFSVFNMTIVNGHNPDVHPVSVFGVYFLFLGIIINPLPKKPKNPI